MKTPSILSAIKKLAGLINKRDKIKWGAIAAVALCSSLLEIATASVVIIFGQTLNDPQTGQNYLERIGFPDDLPPGQTVFYLALACGIVYTIKNLVSIGETFFQNFSIQTLKYRFQSKILNRYAHCSYNTYLKRNSSFGIQVVAGDTEQMFSSGMIALASILSETIIFTALLSLIVFLNPPLAAIVFVTGIILALIVSKILLPLFYKWGKHFQEAGLQSIHHLMQFFHAFKEIILLGKREEFTAAYETHAYKRARIQAVQNSCNNTLRPIIEIAFVGLFVTTIAYLAIHQDSPTQIVGILGGYMYAGFRLMPGLNRVINQLNTFKAVIPSIERVYDEYNKDIEQENYHDIQGFQFEHAITFNNVSFHYDDVDRQTLNSINLEIKKGEQLGIIGETGAGKSTLVDLLLGLLLPTEGSILIDGKYPVNTLQWHHHIGYVPQAIYLTDDTIKANIAFGFCPKKIDNERLTNAVENAQLTKLINRLPEGLETIVGERGMRLSGGERQRIAIARALYHTPDVLVFDEATSALDERTEEKLMETISAISQSRTVIMITHRLSTLKDCDRIVSLENGAIKDITEFQSLLSKKAHKNV